MTVSDYGEKLTRSVNDEFQTSTHPPGCVFASLFNFSGSFANFSRSSNHDAIVKLGIGKLLISFSFLYIFFFFLFSLNIFLLSSFARNSSVEAIVKKGVIIIGPLRG